MLRIIISQQLYESAAVISEARAIMKSSFCIECYVHTAKIQLPSAKNGNTDDTGWGDEHRLILLRKIQVI